MKRLSIRWVFLVAVATLIGGYLMLPTLIIMPMAFNSSTVLGVFSEGWTTRWYQELFTDSRWASAAWVSLRVAAGTTLVSTVLGTAAALGLQKLRPGWRLPVTAAFISPVIIPPVIIGTGSYVLFLRWYLDGTILGLTIAHSVLTIPFVVITVTATLTRVDPNFARAAASLGAGPWTTFRRVTLPMIVPGMAVGALFAFVMSWDEPVVSIFLSDTQTRTLPVFMWSQVRTQLTPVLAAVGVMLTLISLVAVVAMRRLERNTK